MSMLVFWSTMAFALVFVAAHFQPIFVSSVCRFIPIAKNKIQWNPVLVVEWQRLSLFPAKMTLVHERALLKYWENLVLVVVLVPESKALYYGTLYHEEVLPEVSLIMLRTIRWNLLTLKTPISTCYVKDDTLEPINPKSPNIYVLL